MAWYNSSWNYRKAITVSNSGSSLIDYQVLITIDTASLVTATKMKSDCGDIRLTDTDGSTLLSYWTESGINSSSTRIWTKIPSVSAGTKTIYLYYGNSSATTTSNGTNTFDFFEDFANLSKWTAAGGVSSLSIADGTAAFRIYRNGTYRITSPFSMPSGTNYAIEFRYKQDDPCNGGFSCYGGYFLAGLSSSTSNPTITANTVNYQGIRGFAAIYNAYQLVYHQTQSGTTSIYGTNYDPYPDNTWTNYRIIRNSTTVSYYAYSDGTWTSPLFTTSYTDTTGNSYSYVYLGTIYEDTNSLYTDYWVDNFRIRKYSATEPTTCVGGEEVPSTSWLTNWNRRKLITITGSTSSSQTDFQMKLIVHKSTGADTSTDIYLGTNVNNDFNDLRFTQNDGTTLLNYWIESYTSGSVATVWVKIPSVPISPCTTTIYAYYNNSGASAVSNGTNTFEFFDDFSGDLSKWNVYNTAIVDSGYLKIGAAGTNAHGVLSSSYQISDGIIEYSANILASGGEIVSSARNLANTGFPGAGTGTVSFYSYGLYNNGNEHAILVSGIVKINLNSPVPTTGVYNNYRAVLNGTNLSFYRYAAGTWTSPIASVTYTDTGGRTSGYIGFSLYDNRVSWVDFIRVRKYVSPDPTFSTIGSEETLTCGIPSANLVVLEILSDQLSRPYPSYIDIDIISKMLTNLDKLDNLDNLDNFK